MIITCPSCARRYAMNEGTFNKSQLVRCVLCKTTWMIDNVDSSTKTRRWIVWLISFVVFCVLTCAGFIYQNDLITATKKIQTKYFSELTSVNEANVGLCINNIQTKFITHDGHLFIVISGNIENTTNNVVDAPNVKLNLDYKKNQEKNSIGWIFKPTNTKILAKEKILFESAPKEIPLIDEVVTTVNLV